MKLSPVKSLDSSIFRAYDIRGIVGQSLTPEVVYAIGLSIGSEAKARNQHTVVVGRDGRLSGPLLIEALSVGLCASGCDVIDIGAVPTPVLYFATYFLKTHSGVMLTGSHNPPDYNGLKIMLDGETLADKAIYKLYERIQAQDFTQGAGKLSKQDVVSAYFERITQDIKLTRPLKVVVDCGNGIAGNVAPPLLKALGCEVIELFCEVDGNFPNHHPDPSDSHNLEDLIKTVRAQQADVGLAFDGDADRLGVVTEQGEIIWADRQLMLFAQDILMRNPGAQIIYDVKCTSHLAKVISACGGEPIMWKTGHSLIKAKLRETNAAMAGEMSGHMFFKERWYGFDDGIYSAARLLEILAKDQRSISTIFKALPDSVNTPELKLPIAEERKFAFMQQFQQHAKFSDGVATTIDGLRVDFADGWGLVRPSNTTPYLILRFEANDAAGLARIQTLFREQLLALDNKLQLPF
jgi:phosphomannomutase/phosphoglucomutase